MLVQEAPKSKQPGAREDLNPALNGRLCMVSNAMTGAVSIEPVVIRHRVKAFNQVRFQFSKLDYSGKPEPKVLNFANVMDTNK
jgi:hypothetical protein